MPLNVPTLPALRSQIRADFAARVSATSNPLRHSMLTIISDILAGGLWLLYQALVWLSRQLFLDTMESGFLDRRGAIYGVSRTPAAAATGTASFGGGVGAPIPAGTPWATSGNTVTGVTTAAATIGSGGTVSGVPVATTTTGLASNLTGGTQITISVAVANVLPTATIDSAGLTGGADLQSDASFRAAIQARIQTPPQGGAASDYVSWAKQVSGVTRAWCYPLNRGPGTVDVFAVFDGRSNNIPASGDLATIQAVLSAKAPVTADAQAKALVADALTITISGMVPNSTANQAAVTAALQALARSISPGQSAVSGVSIVGDDITATQTTGVLYLEQIDAAISGAAPLAHYDLVAPSSDITYASGHIPGAVTVTFT